MKFKIGNKVERISGELFPSTKKKYGTVIRFDEWDEWVHIEGEYYINREGDELINYYNPDFLKKIECISIGKSIKKYSFIN
jgi:hypothetical protein